jgi:hypothetical protein
MVIVLIATPANLFDEWLAVCEKPAFHTRHHSRLGFPADGAASDEYRCGHQANE